MSDDYPIDTQHVLGLMDQGYAVTFEASGIGEYFCMLRRISTMELINCVIANTPQEALEGAAEWARSGREGNGTAQRPMAEDIAELSKAQARMESELEALEIRIGALQRTNLQLVADLRNRVAEMEAVIFPRPCNATTEGGNCILRPHGPDVDHIAYMPAPIPASHPYPATPES
jgi:hypothetical protein